MTRVPTSELRRILCLRLRSMGDIVLMTPALRALRLGAPRAEIHVVVDEDFMALLDHHPDVDRVLPLSRGIRSKSALARRCRRTGFDAVVNFHGGPTSAWLTLASRAPLRVGRSNYRFGWLYNLKVPSPEEFFADPNASHTVHWQASLVAAMGIPVEKLSLHLTGSREAQLRVASRLDAMGLPPSGHIILQPTASFPSKQWPAERFLVVARQLRARARRDVIVILPETLREAGRKTLVGTGGELFRRVFHPEFPILSGLPLPDLFALMESAALYLGNDSGPLHLAAAAGTSVVGLFGSSDPRRWHPWSVNHRVLWAGLDCSPCRGRRCVNPARYSCLETIAVETVLDAALELLDSRN